MILLVSGAWEYKALFVTSICSPSFSYLVTLDIMFYSNDSNFIIIFLFSLNKTQEAPGGKRMN